MKRLFIAVDLAIDVVERLVILQQELADALGEKSFDGVDLRLVDAPNIHVTLKFLGDTPAELLSMVKEVLGKLCAPLFPFEVECRGVGAFPEPGQPRIVWAGLDAQGAEVLGLLQKALERDLAALGVEVEARPFLPHVTLARVKSRRSPSFEDLLAPYEKVSFGKSYIRDIVLFESHLDQRGPRYEVVQRFALGSL